MRVYNCLVNVGADAVLSTIPRFGLTAPEIMVLQALHGEDRVLNIKRGEMDKRSHSDERARLYRLYGEKVVNDLFGKMGKLPIELDGEYELVGEKEPKSEPADFGKSEQAA